MDGSIKSYPIDIDQFENPTSGNNVSLLCALPSIPTVVSALEILSSLDTPTPSTPAHEPVTIGEQSTSFRVSADASPFAENTSPAFYHESLDQQVSRLAVTDGRQGAVENTYRKSLDLGHSSSASGLDLALRSHDSMERERRADTAGAMTPGCSPVDVDKLEQSRSLHMTPSSVDLDLSCYGDYFNENNESPKGTVVLPITAPVSQL